MTRSLPFLLLTLFTLIIFASYFIDYTTPKTSHKNPKISFIIPCFNDGYIIKKCVESIYESYQSENFELIIINDASTDNSEKIIRSLSKHYTFTFINLELNGGKSHALNLASTYAKHDILAFVDADTQINRSALNDVLNRFESTPRLGAVSCPYSPSNMNSFRSLMQDIEYTMLKFMQWSYNNSSALAARGGCLVVRKKAFEEVGGFALHAITEDMYLAMHLNKYKWRVQQSPFVIKSEVPDNFKTRLHQKIRWCSGAVQSSLSHVIICLQNPLYVLFTILIHVVSIIGSVALVTRLIIFGDLFHALMTFIDVLTFRYGWNFFLAIYGNQVIYNLGISMIFAVFSLPYIIFAINNKQEIRKLILWLPYVVIYMSLYSLVGLYSLGLGIYKYITLERGKRSR